MTGKGQGKGNQMAMQVCLGHDHAHHDSMYTDRKTRADGEDRRQPGSPKEKDLLVHQEACHGQTTRKRQTGQRRSIPHGCDSQRAQESGERHETVNRH